MIIWELIPDWEKRHDIKRKKENLYLFTTLESGLTGKLVCSNRISEHFLLFLFFLFSFTDYRAVTDSAKSCYYELIRKLFMKFVVLSYNLLLCNQRHDLFGVYIIKTSTIPYKIRLC